jgi:hypothetical protein
VSRKLSALLALGVLAIGFALPAAVAAGSEGAGGGVFVDRVVVVEVDHQAVVMPGCDGTFIPMLFTGSTRYHAVIFADGSVNLTGQTRETAAWTEDGVSYLVPFENNISFLGIDAGTGAPKSVTVTLHGQGTASDGTTTRLTLVQHVTVGADGSVTTAFLRGATECGL